MVEITTASSGGTPISETPRATIAGTLLLFMSCLPLLGAMLLIPNLANIARVFKDTAGLPLMISLIVTAPGVMIGLLAPFAGAISDKFGRKRLLVATAAAYSVVGVSPVFLETLTGIVLSRVLLGVCEAVIMTVCTALIADYFEGARRVKYLSLQAASTAISAVVFVFIGGVAAQSDWRAPFWFYLLGIVLAIPLALFAWEPAPNAPEKSNNTRQTTIIQTPISWRRFALPIAFTLFTGTACNAIGINAAFLFPARGFVDDPAAIGVLSAALQACMALSALSFRWLTKIGAWRILPVAYAVQAGGFALVALVDNLPATIIGAGLVSLGFGSQLPALITWALSGNRDTRIQGRISGLWTSAFWIGQLLFSFIFTGLTSLLGDQFATVGAFALATACVAILALLFVPRTPGLFDGAPNQSVH